MLLWKSIIIFCRLLFSLQWSLILSPRIFKAVWIFRFSPKTRLCSLPWCSLEGLAEEQSQLPLRLWKTGIWEICCFMATSFAFEDYSENVNSSGVKPQAFQNSSSCQLNSPGCPPSPVIPSYCLTKTEPLPAPSKGRKPGQGWISQLTLERDFFPSDLKIHNCRDPILLCPSPLPWMHFDSTRCEPGLSR